MTGEETVLSDTSCGFQRDDRRPGSLTALLKPTSLKKLQFLYKTCKEHISVDKVVYEVVADPRLMPIFDTSCIQIVGPVYFVKNVKRFFLFFTKTRVSFQILPRAYYNN